jgi:TetR/AcrR family transcriptional regulator
VEKTLTHRSRRRSRDKRDPRATRRALLDAGRRLFSERGYDAVSVEDLARRARVNKALISYHFGGKRGLYASVLVSGFARVADRLRVVEEAPDALEGLHRFFEVFQSINRERSDFPALFLREAVSRGIEPAVLPHLVEIMGITRRLAQRGFREGLFRRVDPALFHFGLVGALGFFLATEPARRRASAHLPPEMPTPPAFIRHLEEMTVRGLAPGPPPARSARPARRKGARS